MNHKIKPPTALNLGVGGLLTTAFLWCSVSYMFVVPLTSTNQTVIHPAELFRNGADSIGADWELAGHTGLLDVGL